MNQHSDDALRALRDRVLVLTERAAVIAGVRLPPPSVRADLRGLAAGRCVIERRAGTVRVTIRFNARSLHEQWLLDEALEETAPHEVAHAAIAVLSLGNGRRLRPHGPEWLALCRRLGGSGRTTHQLPLRRARRHREFEYRLADGDRIWLGTVRHRRLQQGRARYYWRGHPVMAKHFTGRQRLRD